MAAVLAAMPLVIVMVARLMAFTGLMARTGAGGYGDAAGLAELGPFGTHTCHDLWHVGNDIAAQPHGVGCAGLALGVAALRRGAIDPINKGARQQQQQAEETDDPHWLHPPAVEIYFRASPP